MLWFSLKYAVFRWLAEKNTLIQEGAVKKHASLKMERGWQKYTQANLCP